MKKKDCFLLFMPVFWLIFTPFSAFGENENQSVPGGATMQSLLLNLESVSSRQNLVGIAESATGTGGNLGAGISFIYSDHIRVYQVPVSYTFNEQFVAGLTVPYVYKRKIGYYEDEELENEGLGDISFYVEHILTKKKVRFSSTFTIKMPTGYYQRYENNEEKLPLGTGSYDFIIGGALTYKPELSEKLRLTFSASYRLNGSSSYKEEATFNDLQGTYNFTAKNGDVFNISCGYVYFSGVEKLLFYGDAAYMNIQRGSIGYSDEYNIFSVSQSRNDALSTGDLTLGFKYGFSKESAFRMGITLPVYTVYDEGAGETENRQIIGDVGIDYVF